MTPQERKSLAEQLAANPLTNEILGRIEKDAIEALILAKTEQDRIEMQHRVRAARSFRQDFQRELRNTQPQKGAKA